MSDTMRARLADILYKRGAYCGDCDYETRCPDCDKVLTGYADAVIAAGWYSPAQVAILEAEIDRLKGWQRAVADGLGISEGAGPGYPWHCEENPDRAAEYARKAADGLFDLESQINEGWRPPAQVIETPEAATATTTKWRNASKAARKAEHHWPADCLAEAAEILDDIQERWRPPAELIETSEELDALPDLSIVVIPNGLALQKWHGDGVTWWIGASDSLVRLTSHRLISIWREVTLLYVPTEEEGQ